MWNEEEIYSNRTKETSFKFRSCQYKGKTIWHIIDLGGKRSVTNEIENVMAHLWQSHAIKSFKIHDETTVVSTKDIMVFHTDSYGELARVLFKENFSAPEWIPVGTAFEVLFNAKSE